MNLNSPHSVSKRSVFGCLSFVLKRIISPRTLPTHPFDQFKEFAQFENQNSDFLKSHKFDVPTNPNLVARLMGLDSMPESTSITRSKSTNSTDYRRAETEEIQGSHRRTKTSVSFRETPDYFELEDDDFLVLHFDNGEKKAKSRLKNAKAERRRKRVERIQIKESSRGVLKIQGSRPSLKISENDSSEVFVLQMEKNSTNLKKGKCLVNAKVETVSETENLSPVSVLDHSLFIGDHDEEVLTSEEETRSRSSSPRRKLASELSNLENPSSDHNNEACSGEDCHKEAIQGSQTSLQRKDYHSHQNIQMLNQICRLAELEIANSNWERKIGTIWNSNNCEVEIGVQLGLEIVNQLVDELVHQLL